MRRYSFSLIAILTSTLLALIFVVIGILFWQHDRQELEQGLAQESAALHTNFEVALANLEQQMLALATLVATDPVVQTLFQRGKVALEAEGGGAGGEETAQLREALYAHAAPVWHDMQKQFGLRQLHFQFGPGALSYLRVHTPERFGDRLDAVRHIVVDVNQDQRPRTGFEIGRIYSGVRGVVPVWRTDRGTREHVGVLEAGTSFDAQLERLDRQYGAGFAVLLEQAHVEETVWEQYRPLNGPRVEPGCGCYLEAASRSEVRDWLGGTLLPPLQDGAAVSRLLRWQGRTWHLTRFPLRDYRGKADPAQPAVGSVLVWRDKTAALADWRQHQLYTLSALFVAYLLTQGLLLWLLHFTRRNLDQHIAATTLALSAAGKRLDLALRGADLGLWDWHIPSGHVIFNERWAEMLGYRLAEVTPHISTWEELAHPDDMPAIRTALERHFRGETPLYETEHRMRHKDGRWLWILDRGKVMERTEDGTPVRAVGTHLDITERKRAETRLRESEAMLQHAQQVAHVGSWQLEPASGHITWSAETYRIFGLAADTPVDYALFLSLIHPEDRATVDSTWQAALRGAPYDIEHRIVVQGETRWVHEMAALTLDEHGALVSFLGTIQDITALKRMELELRHLATTDTLTSLPNRRHFLERLEQELARYHRFDKSAALLMLDIDLFKQFNDQYGHAAGDAVLRHFARLVHHTLRATDVAGRLGGEEFALLLPGDDAAGALLFAERLRHTVQENPCRWQGRDLPVTVSIGVTVFTADDRGNDTALARADAALYRAKQNGRNRVESA